jgi:hypothetical protein
MWGGHVTYQSSILTNIRCEEVMWHIKVLYLQALDVRSSCDISKFYTYKSHDLLTSNVCKYRTLICHMTSSHLMIVSIGFCVCLHIVVFNTYCVVFLFCFPSSCIAYVASFSGLPLLYSLTFIWNDKLRKWWKW